MFTYDNTYRYIGDDWVFRNHEECRFDEQKARQLAANKQYSELADYLSHYQFLDPERDAEQNNRIIQLRDLANKTQAYYNNIPEGEENTVDFANSVFAPGGLKQLQTKTVNDAAGNPVLKYKTDKEFRDANPEAAAYIDDLKMLGSTTDREATALKLVFSDKKYGLFGWDKLKKDHNDYYDMLSATGWTEQQLEANGAHISRIEGNIVVEFDKNANCCTRILNAIPRRNRVKNQVQIIGLDGNGEIKDKNLPEYDNPYATVAIAEAGYTRQARDMFVIKHMKDIVDIADTTAKGVEVKAHVDSKVYSSTLFEIQTDRTDVLDELLANQQIGWSEYNTRRKEEKGINVANMLHALTFDSGYEIYTDYFNKDNKDTEKSEIRRKVDTSEQWEALQNIIKGVPASKIHFLGETSGGRVGLHITIDPDALYEHKGKKGSGSYTNKPIQIFIPGFLTEEIEKQMNNDTGLRAVKEFNNMIDYEYKHKKTDGTQVGVDKNGVVFRYVGDNVYIDDSPNAKNNLIRELNEDLIKEEASRLKYRFMNNNGEIDIDRYTLAAKKATIQAIDELYAGVPFEDLEGNPIVDRLDITAIDKLFNPKLKERVYLSPGDFNYEVLQKLKNLYDLYDYMSIDLIRGNNVYLRTQK